MWESLAVVEVTLLGSKTKGSHVKVELTFLPNRTKLLGESLLDARGEEIVMCPQCQMPYLRREVEYLRGSYGKCLNCGASVDSFI